MKKFKIEIANEIKKLNKNNKSELKNLLENNNFLGDFDKSEFLLSYLYFNKHINFDKYVLIKQNYIKRNKNIKLFKITSPREFGENWAEKHLEENIENIEKPNKKINKLYKGEYDLLLNNKKIEVKASRFVEYRSKKPLYKKGLSFLTEKKFDMNFQQLKPKCADVFVFIGVYKDKISYWVFTSKELQNNKYFNKSQHRGSVNEGQCHFNKNNIKYFDQYKVELNEIKDRILNA